jgi:hypothetical protein
MIGANAAVADEKVWERIRRLEALAKSDNENEAESARRLAQKLRRKFSLPDGAESSADVGITWNPIHECGVRDWAVVLGFVIAEAHGCLLLVTEKTSRYAKYPVACRLVGSVADRRAAVLLWQEHFDRMCAFERAQTQKLGRRGMSKKLLEAWMTSESLRLGHRIRASVDLAEDVRKERLKACREAVLQKRIDKERI